jgi:hypothetical protein
MISEDRSARKNIDYEKNVQKENYLPCEYIPKGKPVRNQTCLNGRS